MKWEKIRFAELFSVPSRNGLTRPAKVRGIGYKMINMGELFAHDWIYSIPMERVQLSEREKRECLVNKGDLLFARQSLVESGAGKCSIVRDVDEPTTFESHLIRIRLNEEKANPLFYYYYFHSPRSPMRSIVNVCAQAGIRGSDLCELYVDYPQIGQQHRIASILSTYDDLIENNRRQIKLLEEAAQRLYREWFVELRFPGYENVEIVDGVPEGWQVVFLGDVIEFDPKVPLTKDRMKQSVPMAALSASSMVLDQSLIENTMSNSGSKFKNGDSLLARITPCLENGKTAFVDCLDCDEGAVGSTEFIVMRSKNLNPYMVYCIARSDCFRTEAINSMTGSDGRQRAQKDKLKALSYILPPKSLIDRFEQFAQPCFDKIRVLNRQNGFLVKARDKLLPKLMSGEMEE